MPPAFLAALLLAGPPPQAETHACPGVMIFFDPGSTRLTTPALSMLEGSWPLYGEMVRAGGWLHLSAAADDVGSDSDNQDLSRRRAEAVRRYYLRRGVPVERIRIVAHGEARPFAEFDGRTPDESIRAQNRYVEISPEMPVAVFRRFYPGNWTC